MTATAAACPSPRAPILVNGVAIDRAAVAREAQHHPAESPGASMREAAEALVVRELLLQEARRLGIAAVPATDGHGRRETGDEALIRTLIEREVAVQEPTPAEIERFYRANRARFAASPLFEASHILVRADRRDPAAFAEARRKARTVAADLTAVPDNFAGFARVFSDCPSAADGGHLGQATAADLTPEFVAAATALAEGETTVEPVETRYGFHIIRLHRRVAGRELPLEAVAERIAGYLRDRAARTASARYVARLAAAATIVGAELAVPG